jgi:DNA modification methylase
MDLTQQPTLFAVSNSHGSTMNSLNSKRQEAKTVAPLVGLTDRVERPSLSELATLDGLPETRLIIGDARKTGLPVNSVDLVVTSPPYWKKRDYGHPDQIGMEPTPGGYVRSIVQSLDEWSRILRPSGSVFLNVGDTYLKNSLVGIPFLIEQAASAEGWLIRNRIIWSKPAGMPDPVKNRLTNRHEYVLHLTRSMKYYYDLQGYTEEYHNGANPGDVWQIKPDRNMGSHLAPFPRELVRRAVFLTAPKQVCSACGKARERVTARTGQLDPSRPQAKRAMELAQLAGLTPEHIAAIQATGVSDAGKALKVQSGTGRNSRLVKRLAAEAKLALGGYFREFTFAKRVTVGWSDCGHQSWTRGTVFDPFVGTGTTLKVASELDMNAVGLDLREW